MLPHNKDPHVQEVAKAIRDYVGPSRVLPPIALAAALSRDARRANVFL